MANYLIDANHTSPLVTLSHPLRERILKRLDTGDEFYGSMSFCVGKVDS